MTDPARLLPHSDRIARLVLDAATDFAIVSIDLNGKVTSWNPGAEQVLGWSEGEMIGRDACTFFTEEDQAAGTCGGEMAEAAREGRAEDERWHQRKDGTRFWASGLMMRFDDEDTGEHVGFVKILRDRTAQHLAEQRLRDREEQFELALAAGRLGTWSLDLHTMAFSCDDACKVAFGRVPSESFDYEQLLDVAYEDDREHIRSAIRAAIDAGVPYDSDIRIKDANGLPRWIHVRGVVHVCDGSPRMVGVTTDVTDRKRAEEALGRLALDLEHAVDERTAALVEANDKLLREINERRQAEETLRQAQKMEAVGQLTGGVAHDFNNLLTIIRGSVDLLARPDLPEDRRARYVAAISDTVERATRLTGQLLAFARRQPLRPQVFDLPARIGGVATMLRSTVGAAIDVSIQIAPDVRTILADPDQFDTAMLNLTVNARDAMPDGGTLTIEARKACRIPARRGHPATAGDYVAVTVADSGTGIDGALAERIFEPFFTTKEVGKGTGLGLSQVIGFAKQTGGDVVVESAPGKGARFTLYLPRSAQGAAPEPEAPAAEDAQPRGHGCILVVEDNVQVGEFATQMLHDLGYATCWARTAQAALDTLANEPDRFDAVFSDVVMPGMNGVELASRLRDLHPDLPVLLASGYSQVITDEGSHGFELLHKPYSVDTLARALGRLLQN
jgi:PAS domain S-box-containing protein